MKKDIIDLLSLIVSFIALGLSIVCFVDGRTIAKKERTIKALFELNDDVLKRLNKYTKDEIDEIIKQPKGKEYQTLTNYLQILTRFATCSMEGVYDIKTLKKIDRNLITSSYYKLCPIIQYKEQYTNKDKKNYYADLIKLVTRLNNK